MTNAEKTVFISYRRDESSYIARAIFLDLRVHGYDVFMDVESIDSGTFDTVILNQIAARGHFVLILTPGSVERCTKPDDWLRREIEYAIDKQRNIVPILVNGFTFTGTGSYLAGKLSGLHRYNGLSLYHDYFEPGMDKLRNRFLKQPVYGEIVPAPIQEQPVVEQKIEVVASQPAPTEEQLTAEEYFNRAYMKGESGDYDDAITDYTEAIRLNPQYAFAYNNRGNVRLKQDDYDSAIADYDEAIRLNPQYTFAYSNRGNARLKQDDYDSAIADYDEAIRLDPEYARAYIGRGLVRYIRGDYDSAIADYDEAIRLDPQDAITYCNRGEAHFALNQNELALADFRKSNELLPADEMTLAGMAITHHALGQFNEAKRLWKILVAQDERYKDAVWVGKELNWQEPLVEETRKLIVRL